MHELPQQGFVRLKAIIGDDHTPGVYPVSKSSWFQGIKEGRYPAPVRLGPRTVAWKADDIRALIEQATAPASNERGRP